MVRASSDLNEVHGILDSLKSSSGWSRRESSLDEAAADTPTLLLSPTSSTGSTFSQESRKPYGQWHQVGPAAGSSGLRATGPQTAPLQDSAIFQERSSQNLHLELFGNIPLSCTSLVTPYHAADRPEAARVLVPEHLIQPLWSADQSPLSKVYVEYRDAARRMIARGTRAEQVLGPEFVSVDLFFRDRQSSDGFPVASWACEVCKGFYVIDMQVRLALALLFTYLMRVSRQRSMLISTTEC